jgi:hypothetical protein
MPCDAERDNPMEGIAACMTNILWLEVCRRFIVGVTLLFKSTAGSAASIEKNSSVQFAAQCARFLLPTKERHRIERLWLFIFRQLLVGFRARIPCVSLCRGGQFLNVLLETLLWRHRHCFELDRHATIFRFWIFQFEGRSGGRPEDKGDGEYEKAEFHFFPPGC